MSTPGPPIPCTLDEPPGCCPICPDCSPLWVGKTLTIIYESWQGNNYALVEESLAYVGGTYFSGTKRVRTWSMSGVPTGCGNPVGTLGGQTGDATVASALNYLCMEDPCNPGQPLFYLDGIYIALALDCTGFEACEWISPTLSRQYQYTRTYSGTCLGFDLTVDRCRWAYTNSDCTQPPSSGGQTIRNRVQVVIA